MGAKKTTGWTIEGMGKKPKLNKPILLEGMPGIGNVGKITVDYLIDELKAKKLCSFFSYGLSHSVFVNEDNLVDMPVIELFYAKNNGQDLLLLVGDVQPSTELSAYEFCDKILDLFGNLNGSVIYTLGGIGLQEIPTKPKLYCTGNDKEAVRKFCQGTKINKNLYGVVGPIVGVSGLLLGLGERRKIPAVSLLVETFGHPMYVGLKESRVMIECVAKNLKLDVDMADMDKEIARIDKAFGKAEKKALSAGQLDSDEKTKKFGATNYIG